MVELLSYLAIRSLFGALGLLPHTLRVALLAALMRALFLFAPKLKRYALRNLEIAFPLSTVEWRREILRKNAIELGRLVADAVRLPSLDEAWVREHVSCPILDQYVARLKSGEGKGVLIATGHLGSFELLGHAIGLLGYPLAAVARNFKSQKLDRWWTSTREARGNRIIGRKGAFKEMVSSIQAGTSVAVLFDQNVTRNHALFPIWFGLPAATSRSLALAAVRTEAPIFVASMHYVGDDRYRIEAVECDCRDVYGDATLSADEKVARITQRLSDAYCAMIEMFPEGWFWIHRRWKTRPEGEDENVYR